MNKHVPPKQVETPVLTPAERVEALIVSITLYQNVGRNTKSYAKEIGYEDGRQSFAQEQRLNELIRKEIDADLVISTHVKELMADGLLERFSAFLRDTPTGP